MGFFDKLKQGMNKTKSSFDEKINNVFKSFKKVDEDFLDELEEILIMSDIGMETSIKIIGNLREKLKKEKIQEEEEVKQLLREEMQKRYKSTSWNKASSHFSSRCKWSRKNNIDWENSKSFSKRWKKSSSSSSRYFSSSSG